MQSESLQRRELFAAQITAAFDDGVLSIEGSPGDDKIAFTSANQVLSVQGATVSVGGFEQAGVEKWRVKRIEIRAGEGNDTIDLRTLPSFAKAPQVTVWGGAGDDAIFGGRYAERLFGELGADSIKAAGGDDLLDGGDGADKLNGGAGNDLLIWDAADKTVKGEGGANTLHRAPTLALAEAARIEWRQTEHRALFSVTGAEGEPLTIIAAARSLDDQPLRATVQVAGSELVVEREPGYVGRFAVDLTVGDGISSVTKTLVVEATLDGALGPVGLVDGVLHVEGTEHSDQIVVRQAPAEAPGEPVMIEVGVGLGDEFFAVGAPWSAADVQAIEVHGLAGDDQIDLRTATILGRLFGDSGNYRLSGGAASDELFGGDGDDQLVGAAGRLER